MAAPAEEAGERLAGKRSSARKRLAAEREAEDQAAGSGLVDKLKVDYGKGETIGGRPPGHLLISVSRIDVRRHETWRRWQRRGSIHRMLSETSHVLLDLNEVSLDLFIRFEQ